METPDAFDAIVIGAGPAGAACAGSMARQGQAVLVLDRASFPRFHVGESLVPYLTQTLAAMGLLERIAGGPFVHKHGVELTFEDGSFQRAVFAALPEGLRPLAFNVDRAAFDQLLLETCAGAGGHVRTGAEVTRILFEGERVAGVEYAHAGRGHVARARVVVDASGRAGLLARLFRLRKRNARLRRVAIFQQFHDLNAENNPSVEGDLILSSHDEAWLWGIPLGADRLSVGVVVPSVALQAGSPHALFASHLDRTPRLARRVAGATPVFERLKVEADYCYHAERLAGPGYLIVGDAGCFVDPMFSGGVYLGVLSGLKAAEVIGDVLGGRDEADARAHFESFCKTGYDSYFRLLYGFYLGCDGDLARVFDFFPGDFPVVLQTLSGDFWGEPDQPVLRFLRQRREWDTFEEPFDLALGCPVYPGIGAGRGPLG